MAEERLIRISCPHSSTWLEVAAGAAVSEAAASLCEHAASCDTCGPLLKDAINLLADGSDPAEDEFIAKLDSSQPSWQRDLARRLEGQQPVRKKTRGWSVLQWKFGSALAAVCVVLGLVWLVVPRDKPVSPKPYAAIATQTIPEVQKTSPEPKDQKLKALVSMPAPPLLVAAITLEPGLTRGDIQNVKALKLAPETKWVQVKLLFVDAIPQKLHVELFDSKSKKIWENDAEPTDSEISSRQIAVRIPANKMPADVYEIKASEPSETGTEPIASYSYQVTQH